MRSRRGAIICFTKKSVLDASSMGLSAVEYVQQKRTVKVKKKFVDKIPLGIHLPRSALLLAPGFALPNVSEFRIESRIDSDSEGSGSSSPALLS